MTGGARAGHEEPNAVVAAYFVGGDGRVMDMADDVVPVEELRGGAGPNFEHGSIVQLGVARALLLFIAELKVRDLSVVSDVYLLVALQLYQRL